MKKTPLTFPFLLALFMTLFGSIFFSSFRLMTFAPFLALSYNRLSFVKALWMAFGLGLILDLLGNELRFGLYALNFVLTTGVIYSQKRHFFEDKATALACFSALIAAFSTLLQLILLYLFDKGLDISGKTVLSDVVLMPILDGLYAFLWFTCPMRLYAYLEKAGWKGLFKTPKHEAEHET